MRALAVVYHVNMRSILTSISSAKAREFKRLRRRSASSVHAHLHRIDVPVCPVSLVTLTHGERADTDWSIDRLNNNGAYAIGNLAVMSRGANTAKGARSGGKENRPLRSEAEDAFPGVPISRLDSPTESLKISHRPDQFRARPLSYIVPVLDQCQYSTRKL